MRLFDEVQARRSQSSCESLQQQTADGGSEGHQPLNLDSSPCSTHAHGEARGCAKPQHGSHGSPGPARPSTTLKVFFGYSREGLPSQASRGSPGAGLIGRTLKGRHGSPVICLADPEPAIARRPGEGRLPHPFVRHCASATDAACVVLTRQCGAAFHGQADRARHDLRPTGGNHEIDFDEVQARTGELAKSVGELGSAR